MPQSGHTAGIFADMSLDGPEIGTLVAVIDRAKNLPNRKTMGKQNPYCAMRLGKEAKKTETDRRGGQTPKWDQELRFTVHESPDYYKLKCSIFNDDKKTDLIGEGWIDLKEVVISGGGTNDLWHQLQFKGKYAGEVRIELTYYDTRPKDESVVLKRRANQRSGSESTSTSANIGAEGPRQLGPREVKRRPLPPNPACAPSPARSPARPPMPEQAHSAPVPLSNADQGNGVHADAGDPWAPDRNQHASRNPSAPVYHASDWVQSEYDPPPRGQTLPSQNFHLPPDYGDYAQNGDFPTSVNDSPASSGLDQQSNPHSQPPTQTSTHKQRRRSTQSAYPLQPSSPYSATPANIYSPQESFVPAAIPHTPGDQRQRAHFHQVSTSPTKKDTYRDSPLKQSISHHDFDPNYEQAHMISDDDEPPPPPPAHRHNPSGTFHLPRSPQDLQVAQTPESLHFSPDTRSPLQTIERNYDPHQYSVSPTNSPAYQPYSKPQYVPVDRSKANRYPNPTAGVENTPPSLRAGYDKFMAASDELALSHRRRNASHEDSPVSQGPEPHSNSYDAPPYDQAIASAERRPHGTELTMIKTRAMSPIVPRKSVSPQPSLEPQERKLNGVPFGPDSYDVLNPATSPTNASPPRYETPEQAKEIARQREVEKLRDLGPIIGNDGRVIDPSDHLPTDTWAPEPDRKNRKPEVVIRFRAKDESPRSPNPNGSSLVSGRAQITASPTYGNSPGYSPAESTSRPHRLQKQMPSRPLPVQPYPHPHSSSVVPTMVSVPSHARSPAKPGMPHRPALSEYSVATNHNFVDEDNGPSGSPYPSGPPPLPAKLPLQKYSQHQGQAGYGGYDPLSAEMSNIDIGIGSGGRGNGRSWKGY